MHIRNRQFVTVPVGCRTPLVTFLSRIGAGFPLILSETAW